MQLLKTVNLVPYSFNKKMKNDIVGLIFGIISILLGIISIFIFGVFAGAGAIITSFISFYKKRWILGTIGLIMGLIGIATSPSFWVLFL